MNLVFFGAGPYVSPIIDSLRKNFELALVVTSEIQESSPVITFCRENDIPYISFSTLVPEVVNKHLTTANVDVAVLASFGLIIHGDALNMFEHGIVNVHPSLLPKYRGPTPVQSAILSGDEKTGVTLIKLDEQIDHGPILAQVEEKIEPNDTSESLYKRLFEKGASLLIESLPKYVSGELKLAQQDHQEATFTDRLNKASGFIDLNTPPSKDQLERMVRALHPWPGVWFKASLNGHEKIIKLLPEDKIQVEGKNEMAAKDFANGYPEGQQILAKLFLFS